MNFIKETLVGLPSLPSDEELVKIQEKRKAELARKVQEERRKSEEARLKYQNIQVELNFTKSFILSCGKKNYQFGLLKINQSI